VVLYAGNRVVLNGGNPLVLIERNRVVLSAGNFAFFTMPISWHHPRSVSRPTSIACSLLRKVWRDLDPIGKNSRGLLSLVRRYEWNLKPEQVPKMQKYFSEVPGFEPIYRFKQDLCKLLLNKRQTRKQALDLIPQLLWHMNELLESPFSPLKTFGETLRSWLEPIARMWRFTKNNGITEGLHTKMEMISRRAFGFRNFENYRLRVIALCGWDGVFTIRNHS
jgi:transposase